MKCADVINHFPFSHSAQEINGLSKSTERKRESLLVWLFTICELKYIRDDKWGGMKLSRFPLTLMALTPFQIWKWREKHQYFQHVTSFYYTYDTACYWSENITIWVRYLLSGPWMESKQSDKVLSATGDVGSFFKGQDYSVDKMVVFTVGKEQNSRWEFESRKIGWLLGSFNSSRRQ